MGSTLRLLKYALIAPLLNAALAAVPALSRKAPPWKAINISGSGDAYIGSGESLADQLVCAGLKDGQSVVEIGMGMGGNALALWKRFGGRITYRGFDIVGFAVTWARQHFAQIGGRYEFSHSDVFNSFYNPLGRVQPDAYAFPYPNASADLIFANSVFTHMQEREAAHYFSEAARVIRPGGQAWFSFFLLDADSEAQLATRSTAWSFDHPSGVAKVFDADAPDHAVAFPETWVRERLAEVGLTVETIERGSWRGRSAGYFQDVVIAVRA